MRYTAHVFEHMELAEREPAGAPFFEQAWQAPVWVETWEGVTFAFEDYDGEIGLSDGTMVRVHNIDDEPVRVEPTGLLLTDSTDFPDGPFERAGAPLHHSVFFEFAPGLAELEAEVLKLGLTTNENADERDYVNGDWLAAECPRIHALLLDQERGRAVAP